MQLHTCSLILNLIEPFPIVSGSFVMFIPFLWFTIIDFFSFLMFCVINRSLNLKPLYHIYILWHMLYITYMVSPNWHWLPNININNITNVISTSATHAINCKKYIIHHMSSNIASSSLLMLTCKYKSSKLRKPMQKVRQPESKTVFSATIILTVLYYVLLPFIIKSYSFLYQRRQCMSILVFMVNFSSKS